MEISLTRISAFGGHHSEARQHLKQAKILVSALEVPAFSDSLLFQLAELEARLGEGRLDDQIETIARAEQTLRNLGSPFEALQAQISRAYVECLAGSKDVAAATAREAWDAARRASEPLATADAKRAFEWIQER